MNDVGRKHLSSGWKDGAGRQFRPCELEPKNELVVNTYDHRCALCGIRIVTPDGHTVVEAAHIVPWSRRKNDDIRNGMALCRLCHWGFDEGMLGVSDNYTVITSRSIGIDPNYGRLASIWPSIERNGNCKFFGFKTGCRRG